MMHEFFAILLCILAVFGLYALFSRIAVRLSPKGSYLLCVNGTDRTEEEILLLLRRARLLYEREWRILPEMAVFLEGEDENKEATLRKEGILIFKNGRR